MKIDAMDIDDIKKKRFQFLQRLYELSGGDELKWFMMWDVGTQLGFERELTELIGQYLKSEGLIEFHTFGPNIGITHWGVDVVEQALSKPEKATDYFPPVNIISAGQIVNSQIQQASPAARQNMPRKAVNYEKLEDVLMQIEARLDELDLSAQQKSDMEGHIGTAKAQMSVSEPKVGIIRESLSSIRHILEGMAGSILASEFLRQIQMFFPV